MSADMTIHILPKEPYNFDVYSTKSGKVEIEHVKNFTLTESYMHQFFGPWLPPEIYTFLLTAISRTPQVWVGEVSWLKADLFNNEKAYIPSTILEISNLIGSNLRKIDDQLIEQVSQAFELQNETSYDLNTKENVVEFLKKYKNFECFIVNW